MFWNIVNFEFKYRKSRPATYIYFLLLALGTGLGVGSDNVIIGVIPGIVKANAPTTLAFIAITVSIVFGFFIASAIMGVPIVRDHDRKMESLIYTTSVKKWQYLFGRFTGSFIVLLFVFSGILVGSLIGGLFLTGEDYLPYNAWHHIQPFLVLAVTNAFISGAIFFASGSLSRKLIWVFLQGMAMLVLYLAGGSLLDESLENRNLAALLDPFGINTLSAIVRYWSPSEQNTQVFGLHGILLYNRLLWMGVALLTLGFTYWRFKFAVVGRGKRKARKKQQETVTSTEIKQIPIPGSQQVLDGWQIELKRLLAFTRLYMSEIVRSAPFIMFMALGILLMGLGIFDFNSTDLYDTKAYPSTGLILSLLSTFNFPFMLLIIFYTGQLVWRERDVRINQIMDVLPVPNGLNLLAKLCSLLGVYVMLLLLLTLTGVVIQTFMGYFEYNLSMYFQYLFTETFFWLFLMTIIGLLIQVLVNQKFLGYALLIAFFMLNGFVLGMLGVEHNMLRYASGGLGVFSAMNKFGHFFQPFNWFQFYWFGLAGVLFVLAVVFVVRGTNSVMETRLKLARMRYSRPLIIFSGVLLLAFSLSGCFIYYNTNVLNEYSNSDSQEELQARYEKELKQYENLPQPKIVDNKVHIELYPEGRDFTAEGYYILKNKTDQPIQDIHIQFSPDSHTECEKLEFDRASTVLEDYPEFDYRIYQLEEALAAGDSMKMDWFIRFQTEGFVEGGSNVEVVFNGTFFNNTYFPGFGYERSYELSSDKDRKDQELPERERMLPREDTLAQKVNLLGDDSDRARLEVTIGTSLDQIAIAPGYLQREWEENGRRYFHYKMDRPILNFYNIVSAEYEVMRDEWEGINLEIYYHPKHSYNLERMMKGMKESFAYFTREYSPYQYRQMRILEFPNYRTFAQSFANTVPFSEGIGFVQDIDDEDIDVVFYVTAHELAHQWWAHQVTEAGVRGNAMLSETMSQYSALMVMKHNYPQEIMQTFLKHELDSYLSGRANETKKERPLALVEGQGYIHYRKGSVIMYALQDYISEDSVNKALRNCIQDWAFREDRYPTSADLIRYFEEVTPDSLSYLIDDFFNKITLFENQTKEASYTEEANGQFKVNLELTVEKFYADSVGNLSVVPLRDWIDVGVYGRTDAGKDTLLYLQKHKFTEIGNQIEVIVPQQPVRAGIDPLNKLIDRNPEDNTKSLRIAS